MATSSGTESASAKARRHEIRGLLLEAEKPLRITSKQNKNQKTKSNTCGIPSLVDRF